jgi:hypothetical protein
MGGVLFVGFWDAVVEVWRACLSAALVAVWGVVPTAMRSGKYLALAPVPSRLGS